MRKHTLMLCALLLALSAGAALAADVTGTWNGQTAGPNGGMSLVYHFKQDGAKLTGTVDGPGGQPLQINDGKVEGDKISFTLKVEFGGGQGMKLVNDGTINGDEIKLNTKMEGGPGGSEGGRGGPSQMTLKRSK